MKHCYSGGYLVAGDSWLPVDPSDHFREISGILAIGCNRIACARCGQMVRHGLGYSHEPVIDAATLFATRDWSGLKGAEPDVRQTGRLYVCACESYVARDRTHLDTSSEADPDRRPPWRCAGHPGFVPPGVIAGLDVEPSNGWAPLVAAHLEESCDLHPSVDHVPGFTLTRIFQALEDPRDAEALALAVADRAADPSLRARQAVAAFYLLHRHAPGFERVLDAWRADPARYDEHPSAFGPKHVRDQLLEAIAGRIWSRPWEADELLVTWRWAALRGAVRDSNVYCAMLIDAAWTTEHAERWLDASPADWRRIVCSIHLESPMRLVDGCRRAIALGFATREEVVAALAESYREKADPVIAAL